MSESWVFQICVFLSCPTLSSISSAPFSLKVEWAEVIWMLVQVCSFSIWPAPQENLNFKFCFQLKDEGVCPNNWDFSLQISGCIFFSFWEYMVIAVLEISRYKQLCTQPPINWNYGKTLTLVTVFTTHATHHTHKQCIHLFKYLLRPTLY